MPWNTSFIIYNVLWIVLLFMYLDCRWNFSQPVMRLVAGKDKDKTPHLPVPKTTKMTSHSKIYKSVGYRECVEWVNRTIIRPNGQPRRLKNEKMVDYSQFKQVPILLDKYLKHRRNGKFLEVGAYDGEWLSNSLQLEKEYNWTGVLIEASQSNFASLKAKNRNAYALSACLSNVTKPEAMWMTDAGGTGAAISNGVRKRIKVTCVPIQAVFDAIGWYHFDLITLDVEGHEFKVLDSFDFNRTTVDFFQIEDAHIDKVHLDKAMRSYGYEKVGQLDIDSIYGRVGRH